MRGRISGSSLYVAIECTENAAGRALYDHFLWLETTLVHVLAYSRERKAVTTN
jgi:hypothetical protein